MKIVAIVPVKLNNERLPNKNIMPFSNGKPLCWYIFNTLLNTKYIDEVYVYCSNFKITEFIPKEVKFLKRKTEFDQSSTKMNEILLEFSKEIYADIYVMSHVTSPFISNTSIEEGIFNVKNNNYDSSFASVKLQEFIWKNGKPLNYDLDNIPRTQDLEEMFSETSGFYIYKNEVISKLNRRIGNHPKIVEVSKIEAIDIDEKEDFEIAEAIFNHFLLHEVIKNE